MKVLNIHTRIINQPKKAVETLLYSLSTDNDKVWPSEKWPAMKFKNGIAVGAKGGHGPIRYVVEKYAPRTIIQFRFWNPKGFNGIHKFEIKKLNELCSEIQHTISMHTTGKGTILWVVAIRSLHNALIEDAFDKIENHLTQNKKSSEWSAWVKLLRKLLGRKKARTGGIRS